MGKAWAPQRLLQLVLISTAILCENQDETKVGMPLSPLPSWRKKTGVVQKAPHSSVAAVLDGVAAFSLNHDPKPKTPIMGAWSKLSKLAPRPTFPLK